MSTDTELKNSHQVSRRTGDAVFNAFCLLVSLFLFSQMWTETKWAPGQSFAAQPGFWPRLAVVGMLIFSAANLYFSLRDPQVRERQTAVGAELGVWLSSVQYALWFMAYVFVTPIIGYLASSILLAVALCWWVGQRSGRALFWAVVAAVFTVALFKSFLQVKIPGGAIYAYLPDTLRTFFTLNF